MLKLSDIMTRQVVTVTPQTTLRDAVELFTAKHISGAPVVSGSELVGVISASDVLGFAAATPDVPTGMPQPSAWDSSSDATFAEEVADFSDQPYFAELWADDSIDVAERMNPVESLEWSLLDEHTVDEVMTRGVVSLEPDDDVLAAAELMGRKRIHRVIVVEDDRLVGVVSALDVACAVVPFLEPGRPHREQIHRIARAAVRVAE